MLPITWSMVLAKAVGNIAYHLDRQHRQIALRNLTFAFPQLTRGELQKIAKGAFRNIVLVGVEMIVLSRKDPSKLYQEIEIIGKEHLEKARSKGKGVLFMTGHTGNWETLACLGGVIKMLDSVVARRINNPWVNRWINSIRQRYGVRVIEKGRIREMVREFEKAHMMGTLIDQDGGSRGVFVPYFGRLTSTPAGLVRLGVKSGVSILPIFVRRLEGCLKFRIVVGADIYPVDPAMGEDEKVRKVVEEFAFALESFVREKPEQWLWLHRRWKTIPQAERKLKSDQVLVINDGKKGHFNQVLGVLRPLSLGDATVCNLSYKSRFHRTILYLLTLLHLSSFRMLQWALHEISIEQLPNTPPRLIVASGSASAPVLYVLAAIYAARSVLCMRSAFPIGGSYFDLVILPRHDTKKEKNGVLALVAGTASISKEEIEKESILLVGTLGITSSGSIGVLVGGPSSRSEMTESFLIKLYDVLEELAVQYHRPIIVVSSRRTPASIEKVFQNKTKKGIYFIGVDEQRFQPVAGTFGACEILCVTEDSFSMICEAMHALKPVISIAVPKKRGKRFKFEDSLNTMASMRLIVRSGLYNLANDCRKYFQYPWRLSGKVLEKERDQVITKIKELMTKHR